MMSDITYRMATPADVETLADLRWQMQAEWQAEAAHAPGARQRYIATYRAAMLPELERGRLRAWIAADAAGQPVAAVTLIWWLVPPSLDHPHRPRGQVSNVFTHPDYRRRGIARELMLLLIAYARDQGIQRLILWASDMGEPLYQGLGFERGHGMELALS
jgi:GNAT superfamily N-acetyltransferase